MTDGDERPGRSGLRRLLPSGAPGSWLPTGPGGRRRLAEAGAVAGVAVVVLAFVGATVVLRPTSAPTPSTNGPGLPAPAEVIDPAPGPGTPSGTSSTVAVPGRPDRSAYPSGTSRSGSPVPTVSGSPTSPAPVTTRASAPGPTPTRSTGPTPTTSETASPTPTATETSASPTPTETTDPPPPPVVDQP